MKNILEARSIARRLAVVGLAGTALTWGGAYQKSYQKDIQPIPITTSSIDEDKEDPIKEVKLPKAPAYGVLITPELEVYIPGENQTRRIVLPQDAMQVKIPIAGYGDGYRYRIESQSNFPNIQISIEDIRIIEGQPLTEVKQSKYLGLRNDDPSKMHLVKLAGASKVRISDPEWDTYNQHNAKRAIEAAAKEGLQVLYVFNPHYLRRPEILRAQLQHISVYPAIKAIELGNEVDNPDFDFWVYNDLSRYAQFYRIAREEIQKMRPDVEVYVSAQVNVGNTELLAQLLEKQGLKREQQIYAVHPYNEVSDVTTRIQTVKEITGGRVVVTEIGAEYTDKRIIIPMLDEAIRLGSEAVYVHELANRAGLGYMNHATNQPNRFFYFLQRWAQLNQ